MNAWMMKVEYALAILYKYNKDKSKTTMVKYCDEIRWIKPRSIVDLA